MDNELNHDTGGNNMNKVQFCDKFKAGDAFLYKINENECLIGVYYGGKESELGCLFNVYNYIFDINKIDFDEIVKHEFLYRQPVFLSINPNEVQKIVSFNHADTNKQSYYFRVEVGEESLDYFYENNLVTDDEGEYIDILLAMYRDNISLNISNWMYMRYDIDGDNMTVKEGVDKSEKIETSYCFGVFGNLKMVESSIRGEYKDLVYLSDKIFLS